jgi:threonine aldolase
MRKAMYEAEVGDDVYGEDPTVNKLQEMSAEITGKEAALWMSSGSMGNLIPIYLNCGMGNELLVDSRGHVINYEMAALASIAGSLPVPIPTEKGILSAAQLRERVRPDIYYLPKTKMVIVENTHNLAGGTFYPPAVLEEIGNFARLSGIRLHMDGARLFNAAIAAGASARDLCSVTDTVTFCFSKGLGAPVGAALCGSREFITEARRVRKMLGGGMRQVGILAAACIYALTHNIERLVEDHENAKTLAEALAGCSWAAIDPKAITTNIVYVRTPDRPAEDVASALKERGVICGTTGMNELRFVTHLDVSRAEIAKAAEIMGGLEP